MKKKNITEKKETFQDFIKILLVDNGVGVRPQQNSDHIVAVYGVMDLDRISKKIIEHIKETPLNKLFPEFKPVLTITGFSGS